MIRALTFCLALFAAPLLGAGCATAQNAPAPIAADNTALSAQLEAPGPHQVETLRGVWRDGARKRDVAYLIRYPVNATGRRAIVIFSHGLGGTENGAIYYSNHLASHGFVVVHVRHPGSDASIWGGQRPTPGALNPEALRRIVADPRVSVERFRDIPFAIQSLKQLDAAAGPLLGRLALDRIGMSGHSFGAATTQAAAGQLYPGGFSFRADSVRAFLAMSPSGARNGDHARAFSKVDRPFMFMTGTEDSFGVGQGGPEAVLASRRAPFDAIKGPPTYFLNLVGADHFVFSGREEMGVSTEKDQRDHAIIRAAATAFFSAYLLDDSGAKTWLDEGGVKRYIGADALLEQRNRTP